MTFKRYQVVFAWLFGFCLLLCFLPNSYLLAVVFFFFYRDRFIIKEEKNECLLLAGSWTYSDSWRFIGRSFTCLDCICFLGGYRKAEGRFTWFGVMIEGRMYSLCYFKIQFTHFVKSGICIYFFYIRFIFCRSWKLEHC